MLTITIYRTTKGDPIQFDWCATSEQFKNLCDHLEKFAANDGHEPKAIAGKAIHLIATKDEPKSEVQRRGQRVWAVYAALRYAEENVDLTDMVDRAGVITGPPTIFDLAEHQHMKAEMRVRGNAIDVKLSGRSLDS